MLRLTIFLCLLVTISTTKAQRYELPSFISLYQVSNNYIFLNAKEPAVKPHLPCNKILFIDNRYDTTRLGFLPIYKKPPENIRLDVNLPEWIQIQFNRVFTENETDPRQLLIVVQKLWFSPEAHEKFSLFKQKLQLGLYYNLEIFSRFNNQYFAVKRLKGDFHTTFTEQTAYHVLTDSLFQLLQTELPALDYNLYETKNKAIDSAQLFKYINDKRQQVPKDIYQKGIYGSYNDFLQQKVISDSIEIMKSYDYLQQKMVGCNLGMYIQGQLQSCNQCWGYFDGRYLFVNAGNGFFIRLRQWEHQFILADLLEVAMQSIRKTLTFDMTIGNSSYDDIKDFAKTYRLFYQLDFDNGKLF